MTLEKLPDFLAGVPDGGLSGQVLIKNSNTDYDYSWGLAVGGSGQNAYQSVTATNSGDGFQYVFNTAPVNASACLVFVGSAFQPPDPTIYTVTPPYTITFQPGSGVPAGLVVNFIERTLATNTLTPGYHTHTVTNPAGESNITVPTLDANYCDVFVDGAYNPPSEYTIVSPTQVSFSPPLPVDTVVDFRRLIPVGVPAPAQIHVSTRQTVLSASVDSNGYPNFMTPGVGRSVVISGSTVPLVMTTANGSDSNGDRNYVSVEYGDITISDLPALASSFIYAELGPGGIIVGYGYDSTIAPVYTWGPAITTNGRYSFRIPEMKGYVGNGTTADVVHRVYLGEVACNSIAVTSIRCYALQGRFQATNTALATSTKYDYDANIGVYPEVIELYLENTSADAGYTTNDRIKVTPSDDTGTSQAIAAWASSRNQVHVSTGDATVAAIPAGGGSGVSLNYANWDQIIIVKRGW